MLPSAFNGNMPNVRSQRFDWGTIDWLYEPGSTSEQLSVGYITIWPQKKQLRHIHFGDEQIIYVVSGEGNQTIDDKQFALKPGALFHIAPGASHETTNLGPDNLCEIVVSVPRTLMRTRPEPPSNLTGENLSLSLLPLAVLQGVQAELEAATGWAVTIFAADEKPLVITNKHRRYCIDNCGLEKGLDRCELYRSHDTYQAPQYSEPSALCCHYGMLLLSAPVMLADRVLGIIKAGHIFLNPSAPDADSQAADLIPKGRFYAAVELIKEQADRLARRVTAVTWEQQLRQQSQELREQVERQLRLERLLREARLRYLESQINPHFLFNALGTVAGQALLEDAPKTAAMVQDVSTLLRYGLREADHLTDLGSELKYLKSYLAIQEARFGTRVQFRVDVEERLAGIEVPYLTIQPLVENALQHGLADVMARGKVVVQIIQRGETLVLRVGDNGAGMSRQVLEFVRAGLQNGTHEAPPGRRRGIGLANIAERLRLYMGPQASLKIYSRQGRGTLVVIRFPYNWQSEGRANCATFDSR